MDTRNYWDSYTMTDSYDGNGGKSIASKITLYRILKTIIFILCAAGLAYQLTEYFTYFLTYPTVISIQIKKPKTFVTPAFTVCNANPVQRSKYCAKYPKRCEKPQNMVLFCEKRPHYCKRNTTELMIPKAKFYSPNSTSDQLTKKDIEELSQNISSFNTYYSPRLDRRVYFESPLILKSTPPLSCFTRNDRFESVWEPFITTFDESGYTYIGRFKLNVEDDEMFDPRAEPRAIFSVHSPFAPVNPHFKGEQMKPGNVYNVHIHVEEERLLPLPYQTDCVDYEDLWTKSNKTGPRSQQMCDRRCGKNMSMIYYGCLYGLEMYDNLTGMCNENVSKEIRNEEKLLSKEEEMWQKLRQCRRPCKKECVKLKYPYTVVERQDENLISDRYGRRFIIIEIFVDDPEVQVLSHKPQYMDVELFSYIGGFMGCWIGISLWAFAGIIGSIFKIIIGSFKDCRDSKNNHSNSKRSNRTIFDPPPLPFGTIVVMFITL